MADGKYEQSAVASLTVIVPWYRHCQMERTSRWTVSAEGKWYNGKADGEFVDVPTHRRRAKKKPPGAPARRLVPNRSQSAASPRGICPHIRHSSGANPLPPCSRRRRCRARAPRRRSSCCWSTFTSTLTYPSPPPPPPPPPSPATTPIATAPRSSISPPPAPTAPTPLVQVRRPGGDARRDEALGQPETGVRLRDGHGHLLCVGLRALSQDCATAPSGHRPLPCGTPPNTVPTSDGRCSTLCRCSSRS
jgi:hypothetical protein